MLKPDPSLSAAERVDAACDSFERAWRAGQMPRVEAFAAAVPEAERAALRSALLAVEAELKSGRGAGETSVSRESVRTGSHRTPGTVARPTGRPADPSAIPTHIGRFEVRAVLGAGAFGRVYRAFDPTLDREVAIKVPLRGTLQTDADRDRFLREARSAATVSHPNICQIYEVGEHEGQPYIVMAIVPGQSLSEAIRGRTEPLPERQAAIIVRKIAMALDAAHRKGVVHRDLKPANVMFDKERKDFVVMDFGLARRSESADVRATQTGVIMGTPAYMSPEQARGEGKDVGPAGDIFSLGVIMYELLTGVRPFTGSSAHEVIGRILLMEPEPPSMVWAGINPLLEAACLKALAKDPAQRFASMQEFATAVDGYLRRSAAASAETARPGATKHDGDRSATESQNLASAFGNMFGQSVATSKPVLVPAKSAKTRVPFLAFAVIVVLAGVLIAAGVVFFTRGDKVKVSAELSDIDLKDKSLSFFLNDKPITAEELSRPMELKPDEYVLVAKRGAMIVKRYSLTVTGGRSPGIAARDITPKEPPAVAAAPPKVIPIAEPPTPPKGADPGPALPKKDLELERPVGEFKPLFNGKDLTGWFHPPTHQGKDWSVSADGELIGTGGMGKAGPGVLETKRSDFTDFRLRLKIKSDGYQGQQLFLRGQTDNGRYSGYLIAIVTQKGAPGSGAVQIGSVARFDSRSPEASVSWDLRAADVKLSADEWYTLEVSAIGNRVTTSVNGKKVAEYVDTDSRHMSGRIGFRNKMTTPICLKDIEIAELPPAKK